MTGISRGRGHGRSLSHLPSRDLRALRRLGGAERAARVRAAAELADATDEAASDAKDFDFTIERIPREWLRTPPPPQRWVWQERLPAGCVSLLISVGGFGKSQLALALLEAVACGAARFLSTGPLQSGATIYVGAEDRRDVLRQRLFALRTRRVRQLAENATGNAWLAELEKYDAQLRRRFRFVDAVGKTALQLIGSDFGQPYVSATVDRLIGKLQRVRDLAVVVLDPLSRLAGAADENSNTSATMMITAAERIAQRTGAAVLVLHHTSKAGGEAGTASAHSGRGGSALGDGARSVLVLTVADEFDVKGVKLAKPDGQLVDARSVNTGDVMRLRHAKSSYGRRQRDAYLLRDPDSGELIPLTTEVDERDPYTRTLELLATWLAENPVTKDTFRESTDLRRQVFGALSRADWIAWFATAVARGDLKRDPTYAGDNPQAAGYVLMTRDTRGGPAGGSAGVARSTGGGSAGGTPAADSSPKGGGSFRRVSGMTVYGARHELSRGRGCGRAHSRRRGKYKKGGR